MLNLKKTTLVFFALMSNAVFAGSMGPTCVADDVTMPCERTGWELGVQALYLRPAYSGAMSWVGVNTTQTPYVSKRIGNNPDWAWGFKLEAGYYFNTGNDLNLNWYHLDDKNTQIFSRETPLSNVLGSHLTNVKPSWDAVNLELGQRLNVAEIQNIRIHAGLQVTNIELNKNITGPGITFTELPFIYNGQVEANYTGIGPRLGTDIAYGLFNGFNVYAKGAVAVLAGRSKLTQTYSNSIGDYENIYTLKTTNSTVIAPELEAKLGINYIQTLTNGTVTLDAGYLWANYFNVLFAAQFRRPVDNSFSVNGPYAGLKWIGSAV